MQDRYHFWVQMAQADQTSISAWETAIHTAAGRCSFGPNADELMRDKFLFGLNESFSRFREDIFYRDGQRKPKNPPFTLAFVVSQAMSFEAAQQTNKLLAHSSIEEQVIMPHPQHQPEILNGHLTDQTDQTASLASSVAAKLSTHVTYARPKDKHAATARNRAFFQASANRPSEISDPPDHRPKSPSYHIPDENTSAW